MCVRGCVCAQIEWKYVCIYINNGDIIVRLLFEQKTIHFTSFLYRFFIRIHLIAESSILLHSLDIVHYSWVWGFFSFPRHNNDIIIANAKPIPMRRFNRKKSYTLKYISIQSAYSAKIFSVAQKSSQQFTWKVSDAKVFCFFCVCVCIKENIKRVKNNEQKKWIEMDVGWVQAILMYIWA